MRAERQLRASEQHEKQLAVGVDARTPDEYPVMRGAFGEVYDRPDRRQLDRP
ncbi:hypothetical protein OMP38_03525 [Cohnella ginsengisoli]|uniref:Uncharacterized protein n=1 Tax=Cohnella ginsengisoli TaxID=425004 RepID=A0A9X4QKU2_9BACL|nr:hypothetical protein [Cohnella ginsengisoli]MDG0790023.1 hypothetical protein [Cohnella ginsengisoli]